jgi:hypothetical protein
MIETPLQRRTRLIYEKAARSAARWEENKRRYPKRISEQQKLDRVKAKQIEKLEARSLERVEFYNRLSQRQIPIIVSTATTFCYTFCGFFFIFLSVILLYFSGIYLYSKQYSNIA